MFLWWKQQAGNTDVRTKYVNILPIITLDVFPFNNSVVQVGFSLPKGICVRSIRLAQGLGSESLIWRDVETVSGEYLFLSVKMLGLSNNLAWTGVGCEQYGNLVPKVNFLIKIHYSNILAISNQKFSIPYFA